MRVLPRPTTPRIPQDVHCQEPLLSMQRQLKDPAQDARQGRHTWLMRESIFMPQALAAGSVSRPLSLKLCSTQPILSWGVCEALSAMLLCSPASSTLQYPGPTWHS